MFCSLYLIGCLSPVHLGFFLGFCSILSFGPYFFVSLIWQPPCVYFCVLGRAALTPCVSAPVKLCTVKPQVFTRAVQPTSLLSGSVGGRGVGEETMVLPGYCSLARHLPHFQSLHSLLVCDWHHSSYCLGGNSQSGIVCICSGTVWTL